MRGPVKYLKIVRVNQTISGKEKLNFYLWNRIVSYSYAYVCICWLKKRAIYSHGTLEPLPVNSNHSKQINTDANHPSNLRLQCLHFLRLQCLHWWKHQYQVLVQKVHCIMENVAQMWQCFWQDGISFNTPLNYSNASLKDGEMFLKMCH